MTDPTDLELERFLAGALDQEAANCLLGRVQADPALRRQLGTMLLDEALLRQAIRQLPRTRRAPRLRLRSSWLLAASLALAVAGLGWLALHRDDPLGPEVSVIRVSEVRDASCDGSPLRVGQVLESGRIATGQAGLAMLHLPDGTQIGLAASSTCLIMAGDPIPHLTTGEARCTVTTREGQARPFAIRMPEALAVAMGTRFRVSVPARVEVQEGRVVLLSGDGRAATLIGSGQTATLAEQAHWVSFPLGGDLLLASPAESEISCLLTVARRSLPEHAATALAVTLLPDADLAREAGRLAAVRQLARTCHTWAVPVTITLGPSSVLARRIDAGGLAHLQDLMRELRSLPGKVTVQATTELAAGISATAAKALVELNQAGR